MSSKDTVYSVIINKDKLVCIDTKSGSTLGTFPYLGTISTGPIVTGGDRCTVVFDTGRGRKGMVFKLPGFNTVTTFNL